MATPEQGTLNQRQTVTTRVGVCWSELPPLWNKKRISGARVFFSLQRNKVVYAFWIVLANKCMSQTGTAPAITRLTCTDMIVGTKDQLRSVTTNALG